MLLTAEAVMPLHDSSVRVWTGVWVISRREDMDTPTILVCNPNTSHEMTTAIDRIAQAAAGASARVVTLCSKQGPHTIEGALDAALGTAGMLEVISAYTQPFDAVVVACFGDPGVE